jgi:hypothetical protein
MPTNFLPDSDSQPVYIETSQTVSPPKHEQESNGAGQRRVVLYWTCPQHLTAAGSQHNSDGECDQTRKYLPYVYVYANALMCFKPG